jgi:hypothetical protein
VRWTDLPRDPERGGEQDRAVVQRGEWEDLRRRLERLPAGHPSSPDDDGDGEAGEVRADASRTEDGRVGGPSADQGSDERADRGERAGPDGHAGTGRSHAGLASGPDQREPYQPWFVSGDWPEPWFSADPDT